MEADLALWRDTTLVALSRQLGQDAPLAAPLAEAMVAQRAGRAAGAGSPDPDPDPNPDQPGSEGAPQPEAGEDSADGAADPGAGPQGLGAALPATAQSALAELARECRASDPDARQRSLDALVALPPADLAAVAAAFGLPPADSLPAADSAPSASVPASGGLPGAECEAGARSAGAGQAEVTSSPTPGAPAARADGLCNDNASGASETAEAGRAGGNGPGAPAGGGARREAARQAAVRAAAQRAVAGIVVERPIVRPCCFCDDVRAGLLSAPCSSLWFA